MAAKEVPQVGQNFWSAAVLGVPQLGQKPNPVAISSASVMVPLDSHRRSAPCRTPAHRTRQF